MSSSDDQAQAKTQNPAAADPQDFIRGRDELKEYFKDNARPEGWHFESLIASSFNKKDGPIRPTPEGKLSIDSAATVAGDTRVEGELSANSVVATGGLTTRGDAAVGGNLTVAGSHLTLGENAAVTLSESAMKVGEALALRSGGPLTVNTSTELNGDTAMTGQVSIAAPAVEDGAALTVSGDLATDTATVGTRVTLGGEDAHIEVAADNVNASLLVRDKEGQNQLCLDNKGQFSLGLSGEQSDAKLHIRHRPDDGDTVLRIDNKANDDSPVAVTSDGNMGIGTASPNNPLDVTGSVRVGSSESVDPDNSLSVENRVGVGTASPMARLDIHTLGGEDAVVVRDGDDKLLRVSRGRVSTDTKLNVGGESKLADATLSGNLSVSGTTDLHQPVTINSVTNAKGDLIASEDTHLQTLTTSQKATFENQLIVEGDAKHGSAVGIGLGTADNHNPSASLHVKESDSQPALRVENKLGDNQLLINNGAINLGSDGQPVSLTVEGNSLLDGRLGVTETLTVTDRAELNSGVDIAEQLVVTQSEDGAPDVALAVTAKGDSTALQVSHQNGEDNHALLVAKENKVGINCAEPQKAFHVSGDSRFDQPAGFEDSVTVSGVLNAGNNLNLTGSLGINLAGEPAAQAHIARADDGASLRVDGLAAAMPALTVASDKLGIGTATPERQLDVNGDTRISGQLQVSNLLNTNETTVALSQQSAKPALTVTQSESDGEIALFHDKLGINVALPQASFHLKGDAWLDDSTRARLLEVYEKLGVTGQTQLASTDISGQIRVNTPLARDSVDFHLRQSGLSQTAFRVDNVDDGVAALVVKSGQVGINTNQPEKALDVQGDVVSRGELATQGRFTAKSNSYFEQTAYVYQSLALSTDTPLARIHIAEQETDEAALRVDYGEGEAATPLMVRQGKLGIGTANPKVSLDVKGDSQLAGELLVTGTTNLDHYLNVAQDAVFASDMVVKEKAKLQDQAIVGRIRDINPELAPNAQFYIADTHYKEAFRIDSADYPSLVFIDGKLGLGLDNPRVRLDVVGEAHIAGRTEIEDVLEVDGILEAHNNIEGRGKLDISHKATFGSDALIKGDLHVEDDTHIEEELTVDGNTLLNNALTVVRKTELQADLDVAGTATLANSLDVTGAVALHSQLDVDGKVLLKNELQLGGPLYSGVNLPRAQCHINVPSEKDALVLERLSPQGNQPLFNVSRDGRVAIGKAVADSALDVQGDARVSGSIETDTLTATALASTADLKANRSIQIGDGPRVTGFSTDGRLGGDYAADVLVPTQAAVKAYIDNVVVPFGRGGKTYTISSQADFDNLFNRGEVTTLDTNTTVLLLPLGNQDFSTTSYLLKNSVRLRSGVAIVGFNESTTRIVKEKANCRFELIGSASTPVSGVTLSGFTFDGANLAAGRNGGALYLEHVRHCQLNCRFEHHTTWGNGGAIYGAMQGGEQPYTVSHIEAKNIVGCQAMVQSAGSDVQRNEGGAAYGLDRSVIVARNCVAEQGGAVARCRASVVDAEGCSASQKGGAAYRSPQLRLKASDCTADLYEGKGGAAYYCADLICEGQWLNNNAAEGPHIYASNHLTGELEERHYWKGDYVGRRIDDGTSVWRTHNE